MKVAAAAITHASEKRALKASAIVAVNRSSVRGGGKALQSEHFPVISHA